MLLLLFKRYDRYTMKLKNKVCIVTGAAQGIGEAIATLFAKEGASVIVTDTSHELGKHVSKSINGTYHPLDVSSETAWADLEKAFPKIDVLVNNAGITGVECGRPQDPEHVTYEDWAHVHHVNLDGTFFGCRYAIKAMRKNGAGSIVNMSSRSGVVGIPGAAAYASSKAAIRNHTKSVALYCAQNNLDIRCNSIHPGAILTPLWDPMLGDDREKALETLAKDTPMKRFGTPDEVAQVALFLASDASSYMTGAEINVDGGILAGSAASPGGKDD